MPDPYRPSKEVVHTHNAGALFQEFLKRMDEQKKLTHQIVDLKAETMEDVAPELPVEGRPVSSVLAQGPETLIDQVPDPDEQSEC